MLELLVSISLIALLIAILLPALSKALGAARQVACATKVRQLMLPVNYYMNDYDQAYFPYGYETNLGIRATVPYPMTPLYPEGIFQWQGLFIADGYTTSEDAFHCPSHSDFSYDHRGAGGIHSYGYNWQGDGFRQRPSKFTPGEDDFGGVGLRATPSPYPSLRVAQKTTDNDIAATSETLVFGETGYVDGSAVAVGGNSLYLGIDPSRPHRNFATRHSGGGNVGWADAHVTYQTFEEVHGNAGWWTRWSDD